MAKKPQFTILPRETPVEAPLWNLYEHGVTQGLLAAFMNCPSKIEHGFVRGFSAPQSSEALDFGSLYHEMLDRTYSRYRQKVTLAAQSSGKGEDDLRRKFFKSFPDWLADELAGEHAKAKRKMMDEGLASSPTAYVSLDYNHALANAILPVYFARWKEDFGRYHWESLEHTFDVAFSPKKRLGLDRPKIRIRGKRDGDFRENGGLCLFETKTKGRINFEVIRDTLPMNFQVQLYLWSMRQEYEEFPKGVLYNVVRRPQIRQTKNETLNQFVERLHADLSERPDHYFMRIPCLISEESQRAWETEFEIIMHRMIDWFEGRGRYRNPSACASGFRPCSFINACSLGKMAGYGRKDIIFPELEEEDVEED